MPPVIPIIMAAMPYIAAAGAAVSAYGMHKQGQDQRKAANVQARIEQADGVQGAYDARQNVAIAEHNEQLDSYQATESIRQSRSETEAGKSQVIGKLARSGLDLGSKSIDGLLSSISQESEANLAMDLFSSSQRQKEMRLQGGAFSLSGERSFVMGGVRADATRAAGRSAARAGNISALGTGLSGMASAASMRPAPKG